MLCAFTATGTSPCVALAAEHSPRQYCGPHEAIWLHDAAVAYRKIEKRDGVARAGYWADRINLPLEDVRRVAATLAEGERRYLLDVG